MRAILKTTNPVVLNFAEVLLADAGVQSVVFDGEMSIMDGSVGILPRRLMVSDEDFARAVGLLHDGIEGYRRP
ncbi:MAG: DUF2007 domain-containing protein [Alphaproteobacteria bacterium]|nr:DUF2007 domain-containing protein [Alphaproteobacteria bacterium]MDE2629796.1 DUF2007 domain-containing protein [Alphaproteobacteria bacterium]